MQTHYEFMEKLAGDYHKQKIEKDYGVLLRILARADFLLQEFESDSCETNWVKVHVTISFLFTEVAIATNNGETGLPPVLERRIVEVNARFKSVYYLEV